jgi:hypothetical protein
MNTTKEGFIIAWYAINNCMFRPSGGHHQVLQVWRENKKICYTCAGYFGAEISDHL